MKCIPLVKFNHFCEWKQIPHNSILWENTGTNRCNKCNKSFFVVRIWRYININIFLNINILFIIITWFKVYILVSIRVFGIVWVLDNWNIIQQLKTMRKQICRWEIHVRMLRFHLCKWYGIFSIVSDTHYASTSGMRIELWTQDRGMVCFVLFVFIEPNLFLIIIDFIRIIIRVEESFRYAHGKLGPKVNRSR